MKKLLVCVFGLQAGLCAYTEVVIKNASPIPASLHYLRMCDDIYSDAQKFFGGDLELAAGQKIVLKPGESISEITGLGCYLMDVKVAPTNLIIRQESGESATSAGVHSGSGGLTIGQMVEPGAKKSATYIITQASSGQRAERKRRASRNVK